MPYTFKLNTEYRYDDLKTFKGKYLKEIESSIIVPEYIVNKDCREWNSELSRLLLEKIKTKPEKFLVKMNDIMMEFVVTLDDKNMHLLSYQEQSDSYKAALSALEALGINAIPTVYQYTTEKPEYMINALALGYGNNVNIFLSKVLFEDILTSSSEKEFIIGHELGHNQCNSAAREIVKKSETYLMSRLNEYTADRAGLIACKSLTGAVRALLKLSDQNKSDDEWQKYAESVIDNIESMAAECYADADTHPCTERRIAALKLFWNSEKYAKLANQPNGNKNLLSDAELETEMEKLIS